MIISVSIKQEGYVNATSGHCWLSNSDELVWAFLVPVFVVLILNIIILTASAIRIGTARKNLNKLSQMRVALVSAFILTPVLGMPWVISFAKIITVGIQDELTLQILERFIEWVFICLNAPAGVIFFIIVFKRFWEHKKSIQTNKSGSKVDQSNTTSGFAKFRKTNQSNVETSFVHTTSIVGYTIRKTPSNAEVESKDGSGYLRTSSLTKTNDNESLFDKDDSVGVYSTLDKNFIADIKQNKLFEKRSQLSNIPNPIYEVTSLQDLSANEGNFEFRELADRKLSSSCRFNYDNPYKTSELDEEVRLTQDDEDHASRDTSFFTRGIDFLKNSFKLSSNRTGITDTESGNNETTTNSETNNKGKIQNVYLQHLHSLAERSQSNPDVFDEPETDSQPVSPLRIRRKSSPGIKRQSCEHAVKVHDLKDFFDLKPVKSPLSSSAHQYSKITEIEDDSISMEASSIEQSTSQSTELSQLLDREEKRIEEPKKSDLSEDNVFNSPKKLQTSTFQFQLTKNDPPKKKLTLQKSNSLGNLDQDDVRPASKVEQHVKCYEHIIERSMTDVNQPPPSRKAHSIGSAQRVKLTSPSLDSSSDGHSAKAIRSSSVSILDTSKASKDRMQTGDGPKHVSGQESSQTEL